MPVSNLPSPPSRSDSASAFVTKADAWVAALPTLVTQVNQTAAQMNEVAAGGAYAIPFIFDSTSTADSDPGTGKIRFNQFSNQSTTTALYVDLTSSAGSDVSLLLNAMGSSTSAIKGAIRLVKLGDQTRWMVLNVTAVATPTGYRGVTVSVVQASHTNPFVDGDGLVMYFQRSGDVGPAGSQQWRVAPAITTSATLGLDTANYDLALVTALAETATFSAPTGTPVEGRRIQYRVKDNGTARTLLFNSVFRGSDDLPLPTTTFAGKTLYLGFIWNATDSKWDMVSALNNI